MNRPHTRVRRVFLALAIGAACAAALAPAAAQAATTPATPALTLPSSGIDWAAGKITVSAAYPAGTSAVVFTAGGTQIASVATDPLADGACSSGVAFRLSAPTHFTATGLDATQAVVWGPVAATYSPASFAPSKPRVLLPWRGLIEPRLTMSVRFTRHATKASVWVGPDSLSVKPTFAFGAAGGATVSGLCVPYGKEWVAVTVRNGFGSASSYKVLVYSLGRKSRLPKTARFVLVDKRSMELYDISRMHALHDWYIAIGTPSTPTPNGYFKIGAAMHASGPWGVLRRPLYRFKGSRLMATGFYIHGTNEPWSIGMMASHGCVRMWNWEIRAFTRYVPTRTLVLIRP